MSQPIPHQSAGLGTIPIRRWCCAKNGSDFPVAAFLLPDRWQQLSTKHQQCQAALDAIAALNRVEDHPSRSMVERLIADDASWRSIYDEWTKLVENMANWENLAALLAKDGADKVKGKTYRSLRANAGRRNGSHRVVGPYLRKRAACSGLHFLSIYASYLRPFLAVGVVCRRYLS